MPAVNILSNWDFLAGAVQPIDQGDAGEFLSSESAILCAGPRTLATTITNIVPIGLVQNAQLSQNRQIQQLFEVGSRKPFFIPGRTLTQLGVSRILFDGPSLMKAMYMNVTDGTTVGVPNVDASDSGQNPADPYTDTTMAGSGDLYINLAAEFFNRPTGLAIVYHDMGQTQYGGVYLENCYLQTHSISMSGQQTVLLENVGVRCAGVIPFALTPATPPDPSD